MPDEPASLSVTISPTDEFFQAENVTVRAWKGTTSTGNSVMALVSGLHMDELDAAQLKPIPPPVPTWSAELKQSMAVVWKLAGQLSDEEATELMAFVASRAAYRDPGAVEMPCAHCGEPYRGPAMYCCLACAVADH